MRILIVTDTPITHGLYSYFEATGAAYIATLSTDVTVMFSEDFVTKGRGQKFDLIMIPSTLKEVEEVHGEVHQRAHASLNQSHECEILYY